MSFCLDFQIKSGDIAVEIVYAATDAERTFNYGQPYGKLNATALIERVVEEEAIKIVLFNEKESYRIIAKDDITILAPPTQPTELESSDLETECTQLINETGVENPTSNNEAIENLFETFIKSIENRLLTIKDRFIGSNLDVKTVENSSEEEGMCLQKN